MEITYPLLTAKEVATRVNVNIATVYRWVEEGDLPAIKIGGTIRFNPKAIDQIINPE